MTCDNTNSVNELGDSTCFKMDAKRKKDKLKVNSLQLHHSLQKEVNSPQKNHCMILHVHREETDKLNLIEVAKEFVEKNNRRKQFFGQFC